MISVTRYHDISMGHRVFGHKGKCAVLHGHNYRIHFTCANTTLDILGMVVDFGVIKSNLCQWLEDNWDHKTLLFEKDTLWKEGANVIHPDNGFIMVPFNPTAENIALYLLEIVGPHQLRNTNVRLAAVKVEETAKCSAMAVL